MPIVYAWALVLYKPYANIADYRTRPREIGDFIRTRQNVFYLIWYKYKYYIYYTAMVI